MPVCVDSLKSFTLRLLSNPCTYLSIRHQNGVCEVDWNDAPKDAVIIADVLRDLKAAESMEDLPFCEELWPSLLERLGNTRVYEELGDSRIVVTKGHGQTSPLKHIDLVVKSAETDAFVQLIEESEWNFLDNPRSVIRAATALHDVGKSVSAGLSDADVRQMMIEEQHPKHGIQIIFKYLSS